MSDAYIGEIKLFPYDEIPFGWMICDGKELNIAKYMTLYSILGVQFGGDGTRTFAIPDLRGRTAVSPQQASHDRIRIRTGECKGEEVHCLMDVETPLHIHQAQACKETGQSNAVTGKVWAAAGNGKNIYAPFLPNKAVQMNSVIVTACGDGAAHNNMQPFLVLNYCIAYSGIMPDRG